MNNFFFLVTIFFVSYTGVHFFKKIAISNFFLADINFRTLHQVPTPSGAGIALSLVFFISLLIYVYLDFVQYDTFLIFGIGGVVASIIGFYDDIFDIKPQKKFLIHFFLAAWSLHYLGLGLFEEINKITLLEVFISLIIYVSIINIYNFIDGIDGMAAFAAIFVSLCLIYLMLSKGFDSSNEVFIIASFIGASYSAFLIFNWHPAKIFMGDSGSIFLGYVFAGLFFLSIRHYEVSIWQWFIITGYYLGDTVTTFTIRFIKVKKWYGAHRSHAYQNLARIKGSHKKVTFGVILYCVLWISPLLVISSYYPYLEIAIAVLAIIPSVVFSLKYGPLYSSS